MIVIDALVDKGGVLRACKATGHAGAGKTGTDIVCAAVSVLLRTAIRTLSNRKGINIRSGAPEPGLLWLEADYTVEGKEFLSAVGTFLTEGLASLAGEFPEYCKFVVRVCP